MEDRIRKVNLESLGDEDYQLLEDKMGEKVKQIVDDAINKANRLLNVYGLQAKMQIVIEENK